MGSIVGTREDLAELGVGNVGWVLEELEKLE